MSSKTRQSGCGPRWPISANRTSGTSGQDSVPIERQRFDFAAVALPPNTLISCRERFGRLGRSFDDPRLLGYVTTQVVTSAAHE